MAINLNALNAYRQAGGIGNNGNYNTEAISNSQTRVNTANIQTQQPANISPGQVLGGEVINVKNGEVTLRLDNNATLTAQLDNNMDISAGQKLVFQVTSNGEQMTLHPLYSNLTHFTLTESTETSNTLTFWFLQFWE